VMIASSVISIFNFIAESLPQLLNYQLLSTSVEARLSRQ